MNTDEVAALRLRPGDVVIYTPRDYVSAEQVVNIKEALKEVFPDNKVAVCCNGDMQVFRPEDEDDE